MDEIKRIKINLLQERYPISMRAAELVLHVSEKYGGDPFKIAAWWINLEIDIDSMARDLNEAIERVDANG
jgi:hypothetical protein